MRVIVLRAAFSIGGTIDYQQFRVSGHW